MTDITPFTPSDDDLEFVALIVETERARSAALANIPAEMLGIKRQDTRPTIADGASQQLPYRRGE